MKITEAQHKIDQWIKEYGVRYFNELTNTVILTEEVGELAKLMARKYGEQSFKEEISDEEIKLKISDEMSDIMFVLFCLANQMEIDLENALQKNIEKKTMRDKDRHKNNEKLTK